MEELQKQELLQATFLELDNIVFKTGLDNLVHYEVEPLNISLDEAVSKIRLNKLSRIVYDKDEDNLDKFNNVFSAIHSCDSSIVLILQGTVEYTDIYIGTNKTNSKAGFSGHEAGETLSAALNGNFPGIEFGEDLVGDDIENVAKSISSSENKFITSIAGVPSLKNDDKDSFTQGLEKIIEGMRGRHYTAVIQATPVSRVELEAMENAYQDIYSVLSVFEQSQITMSENES